MAISTYAELKSAVADWVERGDLTSRIPDFIALAESRINRKLSRSGAEFETTLTGVPGSRFISLPTDFDTALVLWINLPTGRERLNPVSPYVVDTVSTSGRPSFWSISEERVQFERPLSEAYTFTLRQTNLLKLSDAAPTNELLTKWPDVYLYGALAEAAPYMLDDERMAMFDPKFEKAMLEVTEHEARNRAQAVLRIDLPGLSRRRRIFDINRGS